MAPRAIKKDWRKIFEANLKAAMAKAGVGFEGLKWDGCTTDQTWGDRCGLVFYGGTPEVNERAARYFERWANKHLRKLGGVGGYESQESISYFGPMTYVRFSNKAEGWHKGTNEQRGYKVGHVEVYGKGESTFEIRTEEVREGFATSYVYYPCAD
jgi:hypothetical protein